MVPALQFLGTCAHDYSKRLQTDCRDRFDPDARRSSCALLCGHILIDCGDHTLDSLRIAGIPHGQITDLVLTHLHGDHFNAENIRLLAAGRTLPLRIWFSAGASLPELSCELHPMEKAVTYSLAEGITVTGLDANHDVNVHPQHLLFCIGGRRLLYATDGAWIQNSTANYLRRAKAPLHTLVIDCTTGENEAEWRLGEHNSIPMLRVMMPALRAAGITDDNTRVYATHLAPSLHKSHAETAEILRPLGISPAQDGLEILL